MTIHFYESFIQQLFKTRLNIFLKEECIGSSFSSHFSLFVF